MSDDIIIPAPIQLGKIVGECDEAYHACAAVSKSKLDDFIHLPAYFHGRHVAKSIPREEAKAFEIGKAAHCLILEGPFAYAERFTCAPEGIDRRTKAGKEAWAAFEAVSGGKAILDREDEEMVFRMHASVMEHPTAALLLKGIEPEVGWRIDAGPFRLQCRTDAFGHASAELCEFLARQGIEMTPGEPYVADIKTTGELGLADLRGWSRNFVNYGYHRQGPFYQAVMKDVLGVYPARFFFIIVSKEAPHGCAVLLPDDAANERGWSEVQKALGDLRKCYDSGIWPSLPTSVQTIKMPNWYGKEEL